MRFPSIRNLLSVFTLAACLAVAPLAVAGNGLESLRLAGKAFSEVAKKVSPAVVYINVERIERSRRRERSPFDDEFFRRFFDMPFPDDRLRNGPRERRVEGQGSGFIISSDGLILTNNHVVGDADEMVVQMQDGREFKAKLVGADERSDVAVIKVEAENLPVLELGDSDALDVGEWVLAVGSPFGLSHSITAGIVSAKGRSSVGITDYENFIQTDAAINPGNSGGPLVDLNGKAVGMNTAIFSRSGGYMGIGFAIPINMVSKIMGQLVDSGSVTRGYLGILIQNLTHDLSEQFGLDTSKGVLIADVTADSPAERSGLLQGDVIVEFDGQKVDDVGRFRNRVSLVMPGSEVNMVVIRGGERVSLDVEIGTLPDQQAASAEPEEVEDSLEELGFTVQNLTDEIAERLEMEGVEGVVITGVENGSQAARAGLRPGLVIQEANRQPVKNTEDLKQALGDLDSGESALLLVADGQGRRYVVLKR